MVLTAGERTAASNSANPACSVLVEAIRRHAHVRVGCNRPRCGVSWTSMPDQNSGSSLGTDGFPEERSDDGLKPDTDESATEINEAVALEHAPGIQEIEHEQVRGPRPGLHAEQDATRFSI